MLDEAEVKMQNNFIHRIQLDNYKSIKSADIELTNLNVLIGANGAGKSNFIGFFAFLQNLIKENLGGYVLDKGGQDVFLYYGRQISSYLRARINFSSYSYECVMMPTNENKLRIKYEGFGLDNDNQPEFHDGYESKINQLSELELIGPNSIYTVRTIKDSIGRIQVFHFDDTSDNSPLKSTIANNDNLFLRGDGANLAGIVKLIYDKYPEYYRLIVDTIRMTVHDFYDFVLRKDEFISLEWFNKNNKNIPWKAHYLSDGSLRFIALATLLLMPSELQPQTIIIDEPELGLHPYAINVLSGLIKRAAIDRQVIISTQSPGLLANLEPKDIIVVDKKDKFSEFSRLDIHDIESWLNDFSLPQLWDMNILGGRP